MPLLTSATADAGLPPLDANKVNGAFLAAVETGSYAFRGCVATRGSAQHSEDATFTFDGLGIIAAGLGGRTVTYSAQSTQMMILYSGDHSSETFGLALPPVSMSLFWNRKTGGGSKLNAAQKGDDTDTSIGCEQDEPANLKLLRPAGLFAAVDAVLPSNSRMSFTCTELAPVVRTNVSVSVLFDGREVWIDKSPVLEAAGNVQWNWTLNIPPPAGRQSRSLSLSVQNPDDKRDIHFSMVRSYDGLDYGVNVRTSTGRELACTS